MECTDLFVIGDVGALAVRAAFDFFLSRVSLTVEMKLANSRSSSGVAFPLAAACSKRCRPALFWAALLTA